jgi:hypothetical protein
MRLQSIKIRVKNEDVELKVGDDIWFITKEDNGDTVKGGIIENFYNNSFKLVDKDKYYSCFFITDIGHMDK